MPPGAVYTFGRFVLDAASRRLTCDGEPLAVADRHLGVLLHLVAHAQAVVAKDALIDAAWRDVAVTDNSLEQAISALRRVLGTNEDGQPLIQTVPRQGYRFTGVVSRTLAKASDDALDALLAPHRAWVDGRAALETLGRDGVVPARRAFEQALEGVPGQALVHVGLANACIMQFEMTRADVEPDRASLRAAVQHAREACRLDPGLGEAWATLGFVLDRTGERTDAAAATRRAVTLEPDNWRHHFRLSFVSWGEERLRAAHRTLALLPGFPLAHWMAATVHVARQALDHAERELDAGIAAQEGSDPRQARFNAVALHWLRGLIRQARGDDPGALEAFARELASEPRGHLYARECCANTWYAIGALKLRHGQAAEAGEAFRQALDRVAGHPMARSALAGISGLPVAVSPRFGAGGSTPMAGPSSTGPGEGREPPIDAALAAGVRLVLQGESAAAAAGIDAALAASSPGNAGWLLPIEPMLRVWEAPGEWHAVLARLRTRAA